MTTFFLLTIYLSFVGLGLPDSLVGAAWPAIHTALGVPANGAGYVAAVVSLCTVISSLVSDRVIKKLGTGLVTALSTLLTAIAVFGFSFCRGMLPMVLLAIPLGLGAGAVDSGLNGYVASHLKARQMNFLHCFWGIGTMIGPAVMGICLDKGGWTVGYRAVFVLLCALTALLFFSMPLWRDEKKEQRERAAGEPLRAVLRRPAVRLGMASFFLYCGIECISNVYVSTYLFQVKHLTESLSAMGSSCFFGGMMAGRFFAGLLAERVTPRQTLLFSSVLMAISFLALILLPGASALAGCVLLGLGCAAVYPTLMQGTPIRAGGGNMQRVIGLQMAVSYAACVALPSLMGILCSKTGFGVMMFILLAASVLLLWGTERLHRVMNR